MSTHLTSLRGLLAISIIAIQMSCAAKHPKGPDASLKPDEAKQIAIDSYVYGYPLLTMEWTRRVVTNVAEAKGTRAPMGHLIRLREYPDAKFRDVTAPNADTLYTTAFLDLVAEPWVLTLPDAKDRYYLFPMLDGWTTVFEVPGKRTTGTGPQTYAITGPDWKGKLPAGVKEYKSPTSIVWILGRIYCTGTPEDYATVHKLQDEITVVPLSSYGKPYTPPAGKVDPSIDMKKPVREIVNDLSTTDYFNQLAMLMVNNPPTKADAPMVEKMARIGVIAGQPFDPSKLSPEAAAALADVPKEANARIMGYFKDAGRDENGWTFSTKTGIYGTNYLNRAFITAIGLGANRPQDAVYPTSQSDVNGKPYSGASKYVLHFDKGRTPPAEGFWSLTMYDAGYFFVENPLNRYNVSSRSPFVKNADGSIDIYIQNESPGKDKEANWLPAPKDRFILMMRLYWPKETAPSIIDGSWTMPKVEQVK